MMNSKIKTLDESAAILYKLKPVIITESLNNTHSQIVKHQERMLICYFRSIYKP
ncbi:hypothetical protein Hanom_Chr09g00870891 [Helianthus anomalus]